MTHSPYLRRPEAVRPLTGRSALVKIPGFALHTSPMAFSNGIPVSDIPSRWNSLASSFVPRGGQTEYLT